MWKVEENTSLKGFAAEWTEPGIHLFTRGEKLYQTTSLEQPSLEYLGAFPTPSWRRHCSTLRPIQRMLRGFFYNVVPIANNEIFLSYGRDIGIYRDGNIRLLNGLVRKCRILRSACAKDANGDIYFGEYFNNPDRESLNIYKYDVRSSRLNVVYQFSPGAVRHIHAIYFDPFDNCLWCLTGDLPGECRILRSFDGFSTLEDVGQGDETWRAVSLLFTKEAIYYGMDAEYQKNHVYRWDRKTQKRLDLGQVDGPIYYSTKCESNLFFGVTAEKCPSQLSQAATLWCIEDGHSLFKIKSYEKDFYNYRYFMNGTIHFPQGRHSDEILFNGVGLKGADNRTFRVYRRD